MRTTIKYNEKETVYMTEEEVLESVNAGFIDPSDIQADFNSNNFYIISEQLKTQGLEFFEVPDIDKYRHYGYLGNNDIRDLLDWFNEKYGLDYTYNIQSRGRCDGQDIIHSEVILNHTDVLGGFIGISTGWKDERSKYDHLKLIADTFLFFFSEDPGSIPTLENFYANKEKGKHTVDKKYKKQEEDLW